MIDFSDADERSLHDRLVEMVNAMLVLDEQRSTATTPDEQAKVARDIDSLDQRIDALVYELYHMTENEIVAIKGDGRG